MIKICWSSRPLKVCLAAVVLAVSPFASAGTKVAFTGDQGINESSKAVLQLIKNEGTDLVLIQGDLGYDTNAAGKWDANLTEVLGKDFPVLSVVGNHERGEWAAYHELIKRRIDRAGQLSCSGNPGVKAHCQFGNIEIVQTSPGIHSIGGVDSGDDYAGYIADKFSGTSNKWRICSWHKNMKDLQTGEKSNSTGWDVYRNCLNAGAMIAVAHEHAYSRTYLMSDYESLSVAHQDNVMTLEPGRSFMFVSGLGGFSIREQTRGGEWWASIYTASQGATHGALFCDFEKNTAECYFKAIDGSVPDQFSLRLNGGGESFSNNTQQLPPPPQPVAASQASIDIPAVFSRTDSDEIRWIDRDVNGQLGNVWIDKACADALGGSDISGDWDDLVNLAPGIDSIASPCAVGSEQQSVSQSADVGSGYVFSRTDKSEFRWIAKNSNGDIASVYIDEACAVQQGGASVSGDWSDLNQIAPALDQLNNPCGVVSDDVQAATNSSSSSSSDSGYVFARTDKDEMRWIAKTGSGVISSVRINKVCASNLGGASVSGDWNQLMELAPQMDLISNPCTGDDLAFSQ